MSEQGTQAEVEILRLFHDWRQLHTEIKQSFQAKKSDVVRERMQAGIVMFQSLLMFSNDIPTGEAAQNNIEYSALNILPYNASERLSYVMANPGHHSSFIQLSEMFNELEKKWHSHQRKKLHTDKN